MLLGAPQPGYQNCQTGRVHELDQPQIHRKPVISLIHLLDQVLAQPGGVGQIDLAVYCNDRPTALRARLYSELDAFPPSACNPWSVQTVRC